MTKSTLRRYTNLASIIDLLENRKITLLDPRSWDDMNDIYFMAHYKKSRNLETLLALCFAETKETYHHWKVFSSGNDGVCVEFDFGKLAKAICDIQGITSGYVKYITIEQIRESTPELEKLPFTKRYPYVDENEFRIIYENPSKLEHIKELEIPLNSITRITLSPWLPKNLKSSVVKTLKSIHGCSNLRIYRSTLIENENWKKIADQV